MVVAREPEGERWRAVQWAQSSVWDDERFLEVNSGDGYTSLGMYLMSQNCALKHG